MHPSLASLAKWSRTSLVFVLILTAAASSSLPAASANRASEAPGEQAPSIYLPMLLVNLSSTLPPTSFELIDLALQQGKLDAETALMYKVFSNFGDARLPAEFRAEVVGGEAGLFMNEVVQAYPALSAGAQSVLAPFFIPPFQAGSWAAQASPSFARSAPGDWASISAAGGKARVWYKKGDAEIQRKAGVVAGALTGKVWPMETSLMGRNPIPDSSGVQNFVVFDHYRTGWNSTFVPFGPYAGMAVPQSCSPTASVIYINPALKDTGNSAFIGLVETTAHEFMHALQFSFVLAVDPCTEYNWLAEATATWAEDYVYPGHNTEWRVAQFYLDSPHLAINNTKNWRDYGEYLLVYYYTQLNNYPEAVRDAWTAAGSMDSLLSFSTLGGMSYDQVASLWNKEPFDTFFKDSDGLDKLVKPWLDTTLQASGGFKAYNIDDYLKPGGARFYHYKIDPSVRTITYLNGLTTKISQGPYDGLADDFVYTQEDVSLEDMRGAEVVVMVKYAGLDQPYTFYAPSRLDFCQDWLTQKVSELVVININNDMTDRDRYLKSTGELSKILVSSAPCMKLTGTASKTFRWDSVTESLSASGLEYEFIAYDYLTEDFRLADLISPEIQMVLKKGSVAWQISGTNSNGCTYTGSDNFTITEDTYSSLSLQYQLLPGCRRFLGYEGYAGPDDGAEVTYTMKCPNQDPQVVTSAPGHFFMPDGETPITSGGTLSSSKTINEGGGVSTTFNWNLTPSTLP